MFSNDEAILSTIQWIWWIVEWFALKLNFVFGIILWDLRMGLIRFSITFSNNFPTTGKRLIGLYEEGSFFGLLGLCIRMITISKLRGSRTFSTYNYKCRYVRRIIDFLGRC